MSVEKTIVKNRLKQRVAINALKEFYVKERPVDSDLYTSLEYLSFFRKLFEDLKFSRENFDPRKPKVFLMNFVKRVFYSLFTLFSFPVLLVLHVYLWVKQGEYVAAQIRDVKEFDNETEMTKYDYFFGGIRNIIVFLFLFFFGKVSEIFWFSSVYIGALSLYSSAINVIQALEVVLGIVLIIPGLVLFILYWLLRGIGYILNIPLNKFREWCQSPAE